MKTMIRLIRDNDHKVLIHELVEKYHDWRLGIKTIRSFWPAVGIDDPSYHFYTPTTYASFRETMRRVSIRKGKDVLLDYGSGKGRVVVMAARYPFRRVIGVEVCPELSRTAEENVRRAKRKLKCQDVQLITTDAKAYAVPEDVSVVYFYSPFHGDLLRRVLENIRESLLRAPRKLTIVYKNPLYFEEEVSKCGWLVKRGEFTYGHLHVIYESRVGGSTASHSARSPRPEDLP